MIKFETNMLVLDAPLSKEDAQAVNEYTKFVIEQERLRILNWVDERSSKSELDAGIYVYNYDFTMNELLAEIRG